MEVFDCNDQAERPAAIAAALAAVGRHEVICLPTDTVYGVGADAFSAEAVTNLLNAKSRTRAMPPPVLVSSPEQIGPLVAELPAPARALIDAFWPGALTIILPAGQVGWDLGETNGTVALRMPDDPVALELLAATGPLAVTSANITGEPPAQTVDDAVAQLGDSVAVYLDRGRCGGGVPSTIVSFAAPVGADAGAKAGGGAPDARRAETAGGLESDARPGVVDEPMFIRHGAIPDSEILRVIGEARA